MQHLHVVSQDVVKSQQTDNTVYHPQTGYLFLFVIGGCLGKLILRG